MIPKQVDIEDLPGPVPDSDLAKIILDGHPYDFYEILVHGKKGAGKSVYSIRLLWEIFEAIGYEEDKAYEKALDMLFFRPSRFLERIDTIQERVKQDMNDQEYALVTDDAGVGLSGELYKRDQDLYYELTDTWQTLREYTTAVILTTPKPDRISDPFATFDFRVKIKTRPAGGRFGAKAIVYPEEMDALGLRSYATSEGS